MEGRKEGEREREREREGGGGGGEGGRREGGRGKEEKREWQTYIVHKSFYTQTFITRKRILLFDR